MTQFEKHHIPLLAEEGWTRHQTRCREASLCWSGRGGQTGEAPHWRRTSIEASPYRARASRIEASPHRARASRHPVCAKLRWLRGFRLIAQPPLLCEEGNIRV